MIVYPGIEVWNAPISGTTAEYTSPSLAPLLANASKILIQARTAQGSGTNPTLTVNIEKSNDGLNYTAVGANAPINGVSVSTSGVTNAFAQWDTTASDNLFGCFLRLKISLGGTTPSANVRVTVTGRSKRRAARGAAAPRERAQRDQMAATGSGAACSCKTPDPQQATPSATRLASPAAIPRQSSGLLLPPWVSLGSIQPVDLAPQVRARLGEQWTDLYVCLPGSTAPQCRTVPGTMKGEFEPRLEQNCQVVFPRSLFCGSLSCPPGEGCCTIISGDGTESLCTRDEGACIAAGHLHPSCRMNPEACGFLFDPGSLRCKG